MRDCMDRVYNGSIKNGEEKLKILEFAGKAAREGNPLENQAREKYERKGKVN